MGEFPARIVAQDFVTPPEFAAWRLAPEGSGRIGGARFSLKNRDGEARVAQLYEQIPIRVSPLQFGPAEPTLVYLINPTAGLLDGDAHLIEIHAEANTRTVVTGQSASRMHPCLKGFCTQQWNVKVDDGAVLVILPGPAIPFAGTRFFQRVHVELGRDARLIWGDLWFAGRYARADASEQFRFECIIQEMAVQREGKLVYRDRFTWRGPWTDDAAHWYFAGQPAAGSIFVTGDIATDSLTQVEDSHAATFTTFAGDTCCRFVGPSDRVVHAVVQSSLRLASTLTSGAGHSPWLMKGHHLAPVHWFGVP